MLHSWVVNLQTINLIKDFPQRYYALLELKELQKNKELKLKFWKTKITARDGAMIYSLKRSLQPVLGYFGTSNDS